MRRVCVFCGSSPGARPEFGEVAEELGRLIARRGWGLVYGGAHVGLMGRVADGAVQAGGEAIGVIPYWFADKGLAHPGLSALHIVDSMHARKALMAELSDGFIALPGGIGTLEELFEAFTWTQLGLHEKPCGLLNICGYYDKLLAFLGEVVAQRLMRAEHLEMLLLSDQPSPLLDLLASYVPSHVDKWLDRGPQ